MTSSDDRRRKIADAIKAVREDSEVSTGAPARPSEAVAAPATSDRDPRNQVTEMLLRDRGHLSPTIVESARGYQRSDEAIGQTLLRLGLVDAKTYNEVMLMLGKSRHVDRLHVDTDLIKNLNPRFLEERAILPLYREGQKLHFLCVESPPLEVVHELQQVTGASVSHGIVVPESRFRQIMRHHFPAWSGTALAPSPDGDDEPVDDLDPLPIEEAPPVDTSLLREDVRTVDHCGDDPLVVRTLNTLIRDAILEGATDIHFEPSRADLLVRYRVDGVLSEIGRLPSTFVRPMIQRIKILAGMKAHITFQPQSGNLSVLLEGASHQLRLSILPSIYGEACVMRVLPETGAEIPLEGRGLTGPVLERFCDLIRRRNGLILVTGPTGSGKSSTLYSALHTISTPEIKMITLEDPAEYRLDGLLQCSIDASRGYDFSEGLREILRHDPDVILIGEIRDLITATIAMQAASTGHLVMSTLHTTDSVSTVSRLRDIGVPPYQLEASLLGVLAQRLVRRVCGSCAIEVQTTHEALIRFGVSADPGTYTLKRARGCTACRGQGYKGRMGVFELMVVTEPIRELIRAGAGVSVIRELAIADGMIPMLEYGKARALEGHTTIEAVISATV